MKLLHTSDWHLGRSLHGVDLQDAHAGVLDQMIRIIDTHGVDAVLVAGDIYDRAVPPVESVQLLDSALGRMCARVPVIVTAGNHDSATRLGFGAGLFGGNLHLRTRADQVGEPVMLSDRHGEVAIHPLPYLDPVTVRAGWDPAGTIGLERSHQSVLSHAMDRVRDSLARHGHPRSVVVAHAFVVAGRESASDAVVRSESERDIGVGGVESVTADVFSGVSYVALGHLHGAQEVRVPGSGTVARYSGSPLRFSLSEATQTKSVSLVDIDPAGRVEVTALPLEQPRGMSRLRGGFDEILADDGSFARHRDDWVEIVVTDPVRPAELAARLRSRFPHLLHSRHVPPTALSGDIPGAVVTRATSPVEVLAAFVAEAGGAPPTERERAIVAQAVAAVVGSGV